MVVVWVAGQLKVRVEVEVFCWPDFEMIFFSGCAIVKIKMGFDRIGDVRHS